MSECEHNTATVLHDFGKFSILKCDWGCKEFLIELELGKNTVTTLTASEVLYLREAADELAEMNAEIARLREKVKNLITNLSDDEIELAREVWGNTNTRIVKGALLELAAALRGEAERELK